VPLIVPELPLWEALPELPLRALPEVPLIVPELPLAEALPEMALPLIEPLDERPVEAPAVLLPVTLPPVVLLPLCGPRVPDVPMLPPAALPLPFESPLPAEPPFVPDTSAPLLPWEYGSVPGDEHAHKVSSTRGASVLRIVATDT